MLGEKSAAVACTWMLFEVSVTTDCCSDSATGQPNVSQQASFALDLSGYLAYSGIRILMHASS